MDKLLIKVKQIDWWETTYLGIYALILAYKFLQTTMFPIQWPSYMNYLCGAVIGGYAALKLICKRRDYTKKELVLSAIVFVALIIPAVVAHYAFLFLLAFLIVGAKDIDFRKILAVYLVVGVTIMLLAFSASQYGIIEDLMYVVTRGEEEYTRHSFGMIYTTDYAAHLFYMVLAAVILFQQQLSLTAKVWLSLLVAASVYFTSNAQTSMISLILFALLCVFERVFRKHMGQIEKILRWVPVACAAVYLYVTYLFDGSEQWMLELNWLLNERLYYGKIAMLDIKPKIFGQYVVEKGNGLAEGKLADYFFIDDSYLRILLEYGYIAFIVVFVLLLLMSKKAADKKQYIIVIALVVIAIHSVMEHHMMEIEYNPLWLVLFASIGTDDYSKLKETKVHG